MKTWKEDNTLKEKEDYDFTEELHDAKKEFYDARSQMVHDIYNALLPVCRKWEKTDWDVMGLIDSAIEEAVIRLEDQEN